ncbi:MAG: 4Fe-4S binding protein, partial [Christensenella sp.]
MIFDTSVQELKCRVLREVARLAFDDKLESNMLNIAQTIIPGPEPTSRCCIYKERAIVNERVKLAMGGNNENPNVVEVLHIACDECSVNGIQVSENCRGCLAHRCINSCPKGAISMVNHRAVIDKTKCVECGKCMAVCPYSAIIKKNRPCVNACKPNAISIDENQAVKIDNNKCISCGACVYQCPFGAIMDKSFILDTIKLIKNSKDNTAYKVYAIVAPAISGQFE